MKGFSLMRFGASGDAVHQSKHDAAHDKGHMDGHFPQEHFGADFSRVSRNFP